MTVKLDGGMFNLRAAGILIHGGRVLITRGAGNDFYFLPGGRVELFEDTAETVIREYKEEIGADVTISALSVISESFFELNGDMYHEVCFYYPVSLTEPSQVQLDEVFFANELDGSRFEYRWVNFDEVSEVNLKPAFIIPLLGDLPKQAIRYVDRDVSYEK